MKHESTRTSHVMCEKCNITPSLVSLAASEMTSEAVDAVFGSLILCKLGIFDIWMRLAMMVILWMIPGYVTSVNTVMVQAMAIVSGVTGTFTTHAQAPFFRRESCSQKGRYQESHIVPCHHKKGIPNSHSTSDCFTFSHSK